MYPQVFGKYILERELGRGGMARILLATLRGAGGFEKKLVVKQIRDELLVDGEFVRRFVEEAKTTVALSHPNIVPVYELGVEQGTYFLAMELVEGLSLDQLLRHEAKGGERNQLFPEEGAYIGVEVCRALDYAHRRMKVVHRDITPRNVMIDEEGQVKLIDFGIAAPARMIGHEVFGSPGHMPPEQVEGRELGPATDIFAVAVLLMEAWSGKPPFRRKTMEECDAAMRGPHPRPSDYDPRLIPLDEPLLRAMSLEPKSRQQDADEFGRSMRHFLTGIDVQDVARTLGARVFHARKKMVADREAPQSVEKTARAASQAEVLTRTFAARGEVNDWSERPPASDESGGASSDDGSSPDAPDAPSTRRIPTSMPPFESSPPEGEAKSEADAKLEKTGPSKKNLPTAREITPVVETIATRPIETPVRPRASVPSQTPEKARTAYARNALVVIGALTLVWFFGVRERGGPNGQTPPSDSSKPQASATESPSNSVLTNPTHSATSTTSASPTDSTPHDVSTKPTQTAPPASVTTTLPTSPTQPAQTPQSTGASLLSPSATSATNQTRGYLFLYGTPGTRVSLDGASARACPMRGVPVQPGTHDVRFVFDQTGESRGERLALKPGESVTLRADFTQATPTIQIQR